MIFETNAIVLKTYDFSEADRIIVLFSLDEGKIRAVAKGVRKSKSKLASSLNMLTCTHLQLSGHEHRELFRIIQAQVLTAYPNIKSNLSVLAQAARIIELVDSMTHDKHPMVDLYQLLIESLAQLEAGVSPRLIGIWFENQLWKCLGYELNVNQCYLCKQETKKMTFDLAAGGIVCHNCKPEGPFWISTGTRRLLDKLMTINPDHLTRIQIQSTMEQEIRRLLDAAIKYHLGRPLKSDKFCESIEKLG